MSETPQTADAQAEAAKPSRVPAGSLQAFLQDNIGKYVVCNLLIGTNSVVQKAGTLQDVGNGYIALADDPAQEIIVCDAYAVRFASVYPTRPGATGNSTASEAMRNQAAFRYARRRLP